MDFENAWNENGNENGKIQWIILKGLLNRMNNDNNSNIRYRSINNTPYCCKNQSLKDHKIMWQIEKKYFFLNYKNNIILHNKYIYIHTIVFFNKSL